MIYNRTALLPLQRQRRFYLYTIFTADDLPVHKQVPIFAA
ncbi:hypothetical protein BFO_1129 [Tannerella forsythia 92A2]|uniref:Uncharacterized protein n=1 Tax=Tannerella forsythia (strain ATCC 43037 / JCM 10827 / CCUG 21028 A / KCTC 5666 / FDC 338) TaxID=203275 RepID=G8UIE3_TANFA|nr:hypothetical protein BFO_1129 [Tannerella forsythia 92A2]